MKKQNIGFIDFILILISIGLGFGGVIIIAGALITIFEGKDSNILVSLVLMSFFGIVPVLGGVYLIKKVFKNKKDASNEDLESKVLLLAKNNNGIVTPTELAIFAGITLENSKKELDSLQIKGYARIEVNDDGIVYYKFDL
jgi:hypothetical protein